MRLTRNIYPGLVCGFIILMLTTLPGSCFPTVKSFWQWLSPDKIVHVVMFGSLAYLIPFGYREKYCHDARQARKRLLRLSFLFSTAYGGATELLQTIPALRRSGSVYDFLADVTGCILGVFIFKVVYQKKIKKMTCD
ncbi:MAG: VanZ family protein [bacterium]|nr:VanZ family protein [Candidatus Limimorpha caballi]MCQ2316395.1 VanZ family protein [Bacteroidales bacterium]